MNAREAKPLDVCLVCYPFYPTKDSGRGVDRYCFELIEHLGNQGARVSTPGVTHGSSEGVLAAGKKLAALVRELPRARADVYHAASPPAGAAAILAGRKPVVVSVHDLLPFQVTAYNLALKSSYARWATRFCIRHAAALIVPFHVTREEFVGKQGVDPAESHVVHCGLCHGVDLPRHERECRPREVLYLGEVSRGKGVDVLIHAFAEIERELPEAKLLICGKPNRDQPGLEELCRSLGLKHVEFRGFVPEAELPAYYARATVMTFPSRYGFGLSSLEAMACGTPVVVAATLDAPEFIGDGGLLARPEDAHDLARQIRRLLEDQPFRDELSRKGIARARLFSWAEMAKNTREVYERATTR